VSHRFPDLAQCESLRRHTSCTIHPPCTNMCPTNATYTTNTNTNIRIRIRVCVAPHRRAVATTLIPCRPPAPLNQATVRHTLEMSCEKHPALCSGRPVVTASIWIPASVPAPHRCIPCASCVPAQLTPSPRCEPRTNPLDADTSHWPAAQSDACADRYRCRYRCRCPDLNAQRGRHAGSMVLVVRRRTPARSTCQHRV